MPRKIIIVGTGPAGLMAATQLLLTKSSVSSHSEAYPEVHLFEKRAGYGRKLLIAGSSGLNISHDISLQNFASHYNGFNKEWWQQLLGEFGPKEWIAFIEQELKLETFIGTSGRYFVREMKASNLLKRWIDLLTARGAVFHANAGLVDFSAHSVSFSNGETHTFNHAIFALGGASWEDEEPSWAELFRKKEIAIKKFEPSNVGYEVKWSPEFLKEAEGKPLKKIVLKTGRGEKTGELVVTKYGLEGTPIYFLGETGAATLDLMPDLSEAQILSKLSATKENLSPIRRVKHLLGLSEAAESLVFHHTPAEIKNDLARLVQRIKHFPLSFDKPRPLSESISSKGGVALYEIDEDFRLKKFKQISCIGEMLDWDAPTGGFLIQACISQGARCGAIQRAQFA